MLGLLDTIPLHIVIIKRGNEYFSKKIKKACLIFWIHDVRKIRIFRRRSNSIFKSMMIPRRQGGGDEAYYAYVEEADDDANKGSAEFGNGITALLFTLQPVSRHTRRRAHRFLCILPRLSIRRRSWQTCTLRGRKDRFPWIVYGRSRHCFSREDGGT